MDALKQRFRSVLARLVEPMTDAIRAETIAAMRSELAEIYRILNQQSDAADEVAEALGRTITRLSAEVARLTDALAEFEERSGQVQASA
jgi:hypothetical protein